MKTIELTKGLDIPIEGAPQQRIREGRPVSNVALVGDDYTGLKPTMLVQEGDRVQIGQPLYTDKKNPGFNFTSPGCGTITAIHRGAKRKFESLIIALGGEEQVDFALPSTARPEDLEPQVVGQLLKESGLWTGLRSRPFGKIAPVDGLPSSLFVTAMDTNPLAADPAVIIQEYSKAFVSGLTVLKRLLDVPLHLCIAPGPDLPGREIPGVECWQFSGPHPAGLPSTHIHHIDPVHQDKQVWQICYQDVIRIGWFFSSGQLLTDVVIALGGPGVRRPGLVKTRQGASLAELCGQEVEDSPESRLLSGSILDGRTYTDTTGFLGRYHRQVSTLREGDGHSLFGWLMPGGDRFSATKAFLSSFRQGGVFPFLTAAWGGRRAIYPLGTYERVIPMDIIATSLLKSLAVGDTEKSTALGCLELVEEDLALCSFVCPGKNEFGPMLRDVLTTIEQGG